jgi:hypothetical protein
VTAEIDRSRNLAIQSHMFDLKTSHNFYAMLVADFDDFIAEPIRPGARCTA